MILRSRSIHNLSQYLILILVLYCCFINCQSLVRQQLEVDLCPGDTGSLNCNADSNLEYSIFVDEALFGIQEQPRNDCKYRSGDCYADLSPAINRRCASNSSCAVFAPISYKISKCKNKVANYFHLFYKCIPKKTDAVKTYNICDAGDITTSRGFITSPDYPNYKQILNECTRKIVVADDQVIKLWITDISIRAPAPNNECPSNYIQITDSTGVFKVCGNAIKSFENRLCSSELYLAYKAVSLKSSTYVGFKLYYEVADRSSQPNCPTLKPKTMTTGESTVSTTTPPLTDAKASQILELTVCKGSASTINAPYGFKIFQIDGFYGASSTGECVPKKEHCKGPFILFCSSGDSCSIALYGDLQIADCSFQVANYINLQYRLVPTRSSRNFTVCVGSDIDGSINPYGIVTSRSYPVWEANQDCKQQIVAPKGKIILAYVTDINIEPADLSGKQSSCNKSYLTLNEGPNEMKLCGSSQSSRLSAYVSCTNTLTISYRTSSVDGTDLYRGFNMYYEVIDQSEIYCPTTTLTAPPLVTTNQTKTTTTQPMTNTVKSLVMTTGGNALGEPCYFPFTYKGIDYNTCTNVEQNEYWCSTTPNYETDKKRGNCILGLTSTVGFDICRGNSLKLNCPTGFLSYIIAAEHGITSDGSCDYKKSTCSTSVMSLAQTCAGKSSCSIFHITKQLADCSNKYSNYLHIEYSCIPDTVPGLPIIDICSAGTTNETKGIIQSPKYPQYEKNLNCTLKLNTESNKVVNIYVVEVNIKYPDLFVDQKCLFDSLTIDDGVDTIEKCGLIKPQLITRSCSNEIKFSLITGDNPTGLSKGVKLFYEVVDRNSDVICPTIPTVTPVTNQTNETSTTTPIPIKPIWEQQGISSPTLSKAICKYNFVDLVRGDNIKCPKDYIIVIRRSYYGISAEPSRCFYKPGDCISYKENPSENCAGKQTCRVIHLSTRLPECEFATSDYLQIEYDCVPIMHPRDAMCGKTYTQPYGIISNPSYPVYDQNNACTVKIETDSKNIIKAYIIDMSISDDCNNDNIVFSENSNIPSSKYCTSLAGILAIETCFSTLNIKLTTQSASDTSLRGVLIYYEAIKRPSDFVCNALSTTMSTSSTTTPTSTSTTSTTTEQPTNGLALPIVDIVHCSRFKSIKCPTNYGIVFITIAYAASNTPLSQCVYNPLDCLEKTNHFDAACSGRNRCTIFYRRRSLPGCSGRQSDYIYISYQCVPTANAGNPTTSLVEICDPKDNISPINVTNGLIIQSPGYPTYPIDMKCNRVIMTQPGKVMNVYLLDGAFKYADKNCSIATDYLVISDCVQTKQLCDNPNYANLLMQTATNSFNISFVSTAINFASVTLRGFKMYIEAFESDSICPVTVLPPTTPKPDYIGFLSPEYKDDICTGYERFYNCPAGYYILITSESFYVSDNGCEHAPTECKQPTDIAYQECSMKKDCSIFAPKKKLEQCSNLESTFLHIEYQCIPASLDEYIKTYTCDSVVENVRNGYITSPEYPETYASDIVNCVIQLKPQQGYGYKIYIIELAMIDEDENGTCPLDFVQINNEDKLCSKEKPRLLYLSKDDKQPINITHTSLTEEQAAQNSESLIGFKFYFETYLLVPTTKPTTINTETTQKPVLKTDRIVINANNGMRHSLGTIGWVLGIGIPSFLVLLIAILCLVSKHRMDLRGESLSNTRINYSNTARNSEIEDVKSFENPNFRIENDANVNIQ